jgi:hypothetical protein
MQNVNFSALLIIIGKNAEHQLDIFSTFVLPGSYFVNKILIKSTFSVLCRIIPLLKASAVSMPLIILRPKRHCLRIGFIWIL